MAKNEIRLGRFIWGPGEIEFAAKGGEGSGHHGHTGLPGVWGGSRSSGGAATITDEEKRAVALYTRQAYKSINMCLREGGVLEEHDQGIAGLLDSAIAKSLLGSDTVVYRGLGGGRDVETSPFGDTDRVVVGLEFIDRAFLSTSANSDFAHLFADVAAGRGEIPYLFEIRLKKGQLALSAGKESDWGREEEYILPRGTVLRIISRDHGWDMGRGIKFVLEVVELKGSSESGHYGHTGLPGVWGGSRPTGTAEPAEALSEDDRMLALWDDEEFVQAMDNVEFVERHRVAEQYAIDSFCEGVGLSEDEFVYMFALPGLRTEIDIKDGVRFGSGLVIIEWFTKDGETVARAEREFLNSETCDNLYFSLDRKYQNVDIGASLYARQKYILKEAGYSEITLHADISIGRYAWAKQGFDYRDYGSYEETERRDKLRDWLDHMDLQTEALVHSEKIDKLLTPHDFATFSIPKVKISGRQINNGAVKYDYVMHLGKAFMLDRSRYGHGEWYGEYDLWQ